MGVDYFSFLIGTHDNSKFETSILTYVSKSRFRDQFFTFQRIRELRLFQNVVVKDTRVHICVMRHLQHRF